MTTKEYKPECKPAATAKDLEATQLVSLDDLKELEHLQRVRANAAEPAKQYSMIIAAGIALGLALAAGLLAAVLRSGGHF